MDETAPQKPKTKKPRTGRPSSYRPSFVPQVKKLCELGATDIEIADFFEVSLRTIADWKNKHPDFLHALKVGKETADNRVEKSLYNKANGYTYDAVKIFMPAGADKPVFAPYREHVPPDTTACIFWLKNRRSEQWRDKHEIDHNPKTTLDDASADALKAEILAEMAELGITPALPAMPEGVANKVNGANGKTKH